MSQNQLQNSKNADKRVSKNLASFHSKTIDIGHGLLNWISLEIIGSFVIDSG